MKFALIDRVMELEPGRRIVAVKAVTLAEEYLAEHFPTFPVLPGVFMLECMTEAARWLVHASRNFMHSVVLLHSAKGVTYKSFVAPGQLLRVEVICRRLGEEGSDFSGAGFCGADEVVKGRFSLRHMTLASRSPTWAATDERIVDEARRRWSILYRGVSAVSGETVGSASGIG
ncbi:MAG: beta-hydroxyacyl-ACP dehydratase [Phycisphaerales bacterium]|nr:beta-hydroxyacyl-ACP dehydratase [Phycisphaerales bacterium]